MFLYATMTETFDCLAVKGKLHSNDHLRFSELIIKFNPRCRIDVRDVLEIKMAS